MLYCLNLDSLFKLCLSSNDLFYDVDLLKTSQINLYMKPDLSIRLDEGLLKKQFAIDCNTNILYG